MGPVCRQSGRGQAATTFKNEAVTLGIGQLAGAEKDPELCRKWALSERLAVQFSAVTPRSVFELAQAGGVFYSVGSENRSETYSSSVPASDDHPRRGEPCSSLRFGRARADSSKR